MKMALLTLLLIAIIASAQASLCHSVDFDYDLVSTDDGYMITFQDKTQHGFVAYVNAIYSTIIPHPLDDQGSPIPSPAQKLRLKRVGLQQWKDQVKFESLLASIDTIDTTTIVPNADWDIHSEKVLSSVKLRITFEMWVVSGDGENEMCSSPFIIV